MWPYRCSRTAIGLAVASVVDVYIVHNAVVVVVVYREVDLVVKQCAGVGNHLGRVKVVAALVVASVIAHRS